MLINGEVPMKDLLLSKSLRTGYAFDRKVLCNECTKTYYELNIVGKKEMDITVLWKKPKEDNIQRETLMEDFLKREHICPNCSETTTFKRCPANLPHVALARKRLERDKMDVVNSGDRIPYVFATYDSTKQFEKVEDPEYVKKNGIPIDYLYYFDHQFKSVIETIFTPMLENVPDLWLDIIPAKQKKTRAKKIK